MPRTKGAALGLSGVPSAQEHARAVQLLSEAEEEARRTNKTYTHEEVWSRVADIVDTAERERAKEEQGR